MSCCHVNVFFTAINHRFLGHPSKHAKPGQKYWHQKHVIHDFLKKHVKDSKSYFMTCSNKSVGISLCLDVNAWYLNIFLVLPDLGGGGGGMLFPPPQRIKYSRF